MELSVDVTKRGQLWIQIPVEYGNNGNNYWARVLVSMFVHLKHILSKNYIHFTFLIYLWMWNETCLILILIFQRFYLLKLAKIYVKCEIEMRPAPPTYLNSGHRSKLKVVLALSWLAPWHISYCCRFPMAYNDLPQSNSIVYFEGSDIL